MTTPPERTNKLAPRWKGPFVIRRVPNPYQVVYEDGSAWRTIHVTHAKPAKLPATGFPVPIPAPEPPRPALGYLLRSLQRPLPRQPPPPPPQAAAPTEGSPSPAASSPAATPPASWRLTRAAAAANRNSIPRSAQPPPTASTRANENSRTGHQLRRSARLTPRACTIKSPPPPSAPQSLSKNMARTYPLSLAFNQCLGSKEDPYSFSSVHLEDLHNGEMEYLVTVQQLVDAIPKMLDPASRFALRGQVTPTGHQRLCHSMRVALWWLLPSDGDFRRAPNGIHYYLARQGRRVVLRGGDVTQPLYESRMNWIHNPASPLRRHTDMDYSDTPVQSCDTPVQSRETRVKSRDTHVKSRDTHTKTRDPPMLTSDTQASAIAINASSGAPLALPRPRKSRRRRRRRNHCSAAPVIPDERWANDNSASQRATEHQPEDSDPTQMKSTPVYKDQSIDSSHLTQPPIPATNRNSVFPFMLERCEFPGLYKPALPDLRQD